jgi:enolase
MHTIQSISAREILDSRGTPTVEVTCLLAEGQRGVASVPSGASTGEHEARELRDGDSTRYNGMGVQTVVRTIIGEINHFLSGKSFDQQSLDKALCEFDGTSNKSRLGANALLGVSLAFAKAHALSEGLPLFASLARYRDNEHPTVPTPMFNVLNGGKHAHNGLHIQEYMLVPLGNGTAAEKIRIAVEIMASLRTLLIEAGLSTGVGDEGGFAPTFSSDEEPLVYITKAIKAAGFTFEQCGIAIDSAATTFYKQGSYYLTNDGVEKAYAPSELLEWYIKMVDQYPIVSIEDPFAEEEFEMFGTMVERLGTRIMIVGDDLLTTNRERMVLAAAHQSVNATIIKPNQIGTLSETLEAISYAKEQGWHVIVSHRSGETNDTAIADIAVGVSASFLKAGAPNHGERIAKYNRLMEIETALSLS